MAAAARTAPKASGTDHLYCAIIDGEEKAKLAEAMRQYGAKWGYDFISRDGDNLDFARCVVILGMIGQPLGLRDCGYCGHESCGACMKAGSRCAHNIIDLGIAVGSAVSVAADDRIDNRVLYSAGRVAMEIGLLPKEVSDAVGIPLSVTSKNAFFDRGSSDNEAMLKREMERRGKKNA
ncbi:MAG: ferredoxin [Firmicutes bacterium]|nr:ferredoxin [Bacillota bacterium]